MSLLVTGSDSIFRRLHSRVSDGISEASVGKGSRDRASALQWALVERNLMS